MKVMIMVSYNYYHLLTLSNAIIIITFKDTNYDIKKELQNKMENAYFLVHFPYTDTYYQPGTLVRLLNVSSDIFFLQKMSFFFDLLESTTIRNLETPVSLYQTQILKLT